MIWIQHCLCLQLDIVVRQYWKKSTRRVKSLTLPFLCLQYKFKIKNLALFQLIVIGYLLATFIKAWWNGVNSSASSFLKHKNLMTFYDWIIIWYMIDSFCQRVVLSFNFGSCKLEFQLCSLCIFQKIYNFYLGDQIICDDNVKLGKPSKSILVTVVKGNFFLGIICNYTLAWKV